MECERCKLSEEEIFLLEQTVTRKEATISEQERMLLRMKEQLRLESHRHNTQNGQLMGANTKLNSAYHALRTRHLQLQTAIRQQAAEINDLRGQLEEAHRGQPRGEQQQLQPVPEHQVEEIFDDLTPAEPEPETDENSSSVQEIEPPRSRPAPAAPPKAASKKPKPQGKSKGKDKAVVVLTGDTDLFDGAEEAAEDGESSASSRVSRRRRRGAAPISYREPSLTSKLRKGMPGTYGNDGDPFAARRVAAYTVKEDTESSESESESESVMESDATSTGAEDEYRPTSRKPVQRRPKPGPAISARPRKPKSHLSLRRNLSASAIGVATPPPLSTLPRPRPIPLIPATAAPAPIPVRPDETKIPRSRVPRPAGKRKTAEAVADAIDELMFGSSENDGGNSQPASSRAIFNAHARTMSGSARPLQTRRFGI